MTQITTGPRFLCDEPCDLGLRDSDGGGGVNAGGVHSFFPRLIELWTPQDVKTCDSESRKSPQSADIGAEVERKYE